MNISAEYFVRLLFRIFGKCITQANIFCRIFQQCSTIKIPEWSDSHKEKPLGKSTVHPNGLAYRCQCFEERLGLNS